jgi:hypothetical protein
MAQLEAATRGQLAAAQKSEANQAAAGADRRASYR